MAGRRRRASGHTGRLFVLVESRDDHQPEDAEAVEHNHTLPGHSHPNENNGKGCHGEGRIAHRQQRADHQATRCQSQGIAAFNPFEHQGSRFWGGDETQEQPHSNDPQDVKSVEGMPDFEIAGCIEQEHGYLTVKGSRTRKVNLEMRSLSIFVGVNA